MLLKIRLTKLTISAVVRTGQVAKIGAKRYVGRPVGGQMGYLVGSTNYDMLQVQNGS
jgi:hypothetical protein